MEINHRPGPLLLSSWRHSLTWWYTVLTTSRLNGTHVSLVNHFRVTHESSCEYACANVISQREIALPTLLVLMCVNWQRFPFDVTSSEVFEMCTPFSSKWALMSKPFLDRIITLHWLSVAILVIVPREHSLRMAILRRKTSEPTTINWRVCALARALASLLTRLTRSTEHLMCGSDASRVQVTCETHACAV